MTLKQRIELLAAQDNPIYSSFIDVVNPEHFEAESDLVKVWNKLAPEVITFPKLSFSFSRPAFKLTAQGSKASSEFYTGQAGADLHTFYHHEGNTVDIYKSERTGSGYQTSVKSMGQALAIVPGPIFRLLSAVMIEPMQNPDDEYWKNQFRNPYFHSYMVAGIDGIVHVFPTPLPEVQDTTDSCLAHEMGHVLSLRFWSEQLDHPGWKNYVKAVKSDRIRPSNYSRQSPHEDFAETFRLYVLYHRLAQYKYLEKIFPARFEIISNLLERIV